MTTKTQYRVCYDAPEGHSYPGAPDKVEYETDSLEVAREFVRRQLGDLDASRLWSPSRDDNSGWNCVEGYYESQDEGCGSYIIEQQQREGNDEN